MAFQVSPGINVSEIDATNVTAVAGTSTGALAGQFTWGPANKRILVDSENTLVSVFGKPTSNTYQTFFSAANFLAYTNNLLVVRAVGSTTYNAVANNTAIPASIANESVWENLYDIRSGQTGAKDLGSFVSRYPGELGNSLGIAVCSDIDLFRTPTLYANTVNNSNQIVLSANVSSQYPGFKANDILTVSGTDYTISTISGNTITTTANTISTQNTQPAVISWKYSSIFTRSPNTSIYATAQNSSSDELHLVVVDKDGRISGVQGTVLEKYESVSKAVDAKTDDGSSNYYVNVIFNKSKYIYVANHLTGNVNWGTNSSGTTFSQLQNYEVTLTGGSSAAPQTSDIVSAYDLFGNPAEVDVSLIISGEPDLTIANKVLSLAQQRKDAVAFISPLRKDVVSAFNLDKIIAHRNSLSPSSSYGLMDSGFKYQFDKYNNVYRYVALNADIAGLCARTDSVRDPWWSPAGFNRGQILNAVKLAWNPSKTQSDLLYQNNINTVSAFPGEGIVLFGDKTLQGKASAFDRINVRRLFIVLEKTIANAAKYSLFEFNDAFTRSQFVSIVEPFLRDVQARRGIYDYKVICDETNNTPQVIDSNGFVGDIYIKPAKSINYIQLNFVAVRTGVDFSEIAGIA
jgi:hypothetical protein